MRTAGLGILMSVMSFATAETVLPVGRISHLVILNKVYLNGEGPFRMLIDTGNTSSAVRPAVARRLGLRAAYAVEVQSTAGASAAAVAILDEVRVGGLLDRSVEVIITDLRLRGVDGVLGQSWLAGHDYLLDYRHGRFVMDAPAPGQGLRTPLRSGDGRPEISAELDGRRQDLVVDSGASTLVVFGSATPVTSTVLVTNTGSVPAATSNAEIAIGQYRRRLAAVVVDAPAQPALLPASAFHAVYISNRHGIVILAP